MKRTEWIFLALVVAALVAVILFKGRNPFATPRTTTIVGDSVTPDNTSFVSGPAYLMYNQPWYFGPEIAPFLPTLTAGAAGQVGINPPPFSKR
jgi:hypothetical protein